jgi:hypothetical protein
VAHVGIIEVIIMRLLDGALEKALLIRDAGLPR